MPAAPRPPVSAFQVLGGATDVRCGLGECPTWDSAHERLYWVDIPCGAVHCIDGSERHSVWHHHDSVSAVAPRAGAGLAFVTCDAIGLSDGFGENPRLVRIPVRANTCANDAKCDRRGRLWLGSKVRRQGARTASLLRIDPSGKARAMVHGLGMANGLGWSPDDQVFYLVDSAAGAIYAFGFDIESGELGQRGLFVHVPADTGIPDGLAVDANGYVWVALWGAGKLHRYAPDGRLDCSLEVPAPQVTSCAFGGPGLDRLYVTSARASLSERDRRRQPRSGAVFVADVQAPGTPVGGFGG